MYKTDLLKRWQLQVPDEIIIGEDVSVVYPLLFDAKRVYVSGKNYYHYFLRTDSLMGTKAVGNADSCYKMFSYVRSTMCSLGVQKFFEPQFCLYDIYIQLMRNPKEVLCYEHGFLWPLGEIRKSDAVILYGGGRFGVALKSFFEDNEFNVIAWVDNSSSITGTVKWENAKLLDFDKIVVATLHYKTTQSILQFLKQEGIDEECINTVTVEKIKSRWI